MADGAKRLPGNVSHLQRLVGDHAAERGMPPARLQRWLNAMIVTAVLDRSRDGDDFTPGDIDAAVAAMTALIAAIDAATDDSRENNP